MRLNRHWGISLVTTALLIGGGATIAHAASGASSEIGGNQSATVLPEGDGPGTPAGDGSQAYPLPEGDGPGTPAGDETYRP
ncbi:hypothetical protein G3M53_38730, partial [Streptomyces sp. SID7982]|nr:hypothetical protein [Streptomyces sp. SID7982]